MPIEVARPMKSYALDELRGAQPNDRYAIALLRRVQRRSCHGTHVGVVKAVSALRG